MAFDAEAMPTAADRPRPAGSDIRKMTTGEIRPVAAALARAFYDDPHFRWIVRDDEARLGRLERAPRFGGCGASRIGSAARIAGPALTRT